MLYVRGRHNMIPITTATQHSNAIHALIRVNTTERYMLNDKKHKTLEYVFINEVTAVVKSNLCQYNIRHQHLHHINYNANTTNCGSHVLMSLFSTTYKIAFSNIYRKRIEHTQIIYYLVTILLKNKNY